MARQNLHVRSCLCLIIVLVISQLSAGRVYGEEPCAKFLEALREAKMYDIAFEYLEAMENSELASAEFKRKIPLSKVAVLLDEITQIRDPQKITDRLNRTEAVLKTFIESKPPALLLAQAQQQQSRLSVARAERLLDRAKSDRITVARRQELQTTARDYLRQASDTYGTIRERLRAELDAFQMDPQAPRESVKKRDELRGQYVKVRMQSPKIKERVADSYGVDHPEYKKLLREAAEENLELYSKYRDRLSGIDGAINAGRCYVKLGEPGKALGYLVEIFNLPRGAAQAMKKRDAALVALDCWEAMNPYPVEEVFLYLQSVVYSLSPEFRRTPNGVRMQVAFAKACKLKADKIKNAGPQDQEERRQMTMFRNEANSIMRSVMRIPGPHRSSVAKTLAKWGNSVADASSAESGPPKTLAEARGRGKDIQLQVTELSENLGRRRAELANAQDEAQKSKLQQDIDSLFSEIESQSRKALEMFELAYTFVNKDTAIDDITNLRYLQSTSYFQMERFFETTIIGEFLMNRYPNNSGARQAAGLVCKSYWQIYRSDTSGDKSFELSQLKKHCEFVFEKWPGSSQAETAGLLMTLISLSEKDAVAADEYLKKIPESSPLRSKVVLEVGNRLWQLYVREKKKSKELPSDDLVSIRDRAQQLLEDGIAFLNLENLSPYEARAALSLTEVYLDSSQNDAAITQLEDAAIAPLDLVKQKHPATQASSFRRDTYKTAVRAYLAQLRQSQDAMKWIEKSQGVIAALKNELGDSPEGKRQLAGIYLALSRELNQQFQSLKSPDQKRIFAQGLESFLTALQSNTTDNQILLLTATMMAEIGQSLKDNELNDQSLRFFTSAVKLFDRLDVDQADDKIKLAVLRGRANSLRGQGKYEEAIKQFGDILAVPENQKYVDIQVDAAATYKEWGVANKISGPLAKSVQGGEKRPFAGGRPENVIWGWFKLAKAARRAKKPELFAESVYNLALCKFEFGLIKKDEKMQRSAIAEIEKFEKNQPEMGGSIWKSQFQSLKQRINTKLGK